VVILLRPLLVAAFKASLALVCGPAAAQTPEAKIAWWSGEYDAAFVEAKARNVPLMFVFLQDGEEANERIVTSVFTDPDYIKATKRAVVAVLSHDSHPSKQETVDGEARAVCAKFGGCPCETHKRLEYPARKDFIGERVQTPQHVVILPDKTVFEHLLDVSPPNAYVDALRRAQVKLGPGVGRAEYRAAAKAVAEGERLVSAGDYLGAAKVARAALETVKGTKCAKGPEGVLETVEKAGRGRIDEAIKAEKASDVYRALKLLEEGGRDFAGANVVTAMKKESERIKATKAGREAASTLAREARAAPGWTAAEKAVEERDFLRARREFDKVAKVAEGTPLGGAASRRSAALAADPDLKALFDRADRDAAADAALRGAEGLLRSGEGSKGKAALEALVKDYAGTKAADAAKKRLAELK
jgi:hypothetical protein